MGQLRSSQAADPSLSRAQQLLELSELQQRGAEQVAEHPLELLGTQGTTSRGCQGWNISSALAARGCLAAEPFPRLPSLQSCPASSCGDVFLPLPKRLQTKPFVRQSFRLSPADWDGREKSMTHSSLLDHITAERPSPKQQEHLNLCLCQAAWVWGGHKGREQDSSRRKVPGPAWLRKPGG